jgi:sugar phosphate isomerase/epimerase
MTMTRREWLHGVGGGVALAAVWPAAATTRGQASGAARRSVTLGVQSYSFRDRPIDDAITAMQQIGLTCCELGQGHVEPRGVQRPELRRWRETVSLDDFRALKDKFDRAKVQIAAYNISFRDDYSDAEIARGFEMTRALGADTITASASTGVVPRVASVAARHQIRVGMHNHSRVDPNEFATPESFTTALKAGPFIAVNLDIGHFTAANFDAVAFLQEHHARIVTLHIKDRKRDNGPNLPFGDGDTPIGPVLRLLRDRGWPIPANIEYEYKGGDTVEEVKRCLEFCRRELES